MAALAVRTELFTNTETIMSAQQYNEMFTMHGVIMVFLVIIPSIPAALGNFVLPLQLGAKDVAFPRLNLLSYYIYVTGALFGVYAMLSDGVDTGWTFYPLLRSIEWRGCFNDTSGIHFRIFLHSYRDELHDYRP